MVLQETLAKHVIVIRRVGDSTDIQSTGIETFGESVGAITSDVFGLNSQITDFHKTLDEIMLVTPSLADIDYLFRPHGLSSQARAYVMSQLARKQVNR